MNDITTKYSTLYKTNHWSRLLEVYTPTNIGLTITKIERLHTQFAIYYLLQTLRKSINVVI